MCQQMEEIHLNKALLLVFKLMSRNKGEPGLYLTYVYVQEKHVT